MGVTATGVRRGTLAASGFADQFHTALCSVLYAPLEKTSKRCKNAFLRAFWSDLITLNYFLR